MVSSVVNIVLDLLFIRGFSWGVAGAAFATIIAQLISGIGSLIFALVKNPFFRIEKKYRSLNRGIIWQCIRMGVPLAFAELTDCDFLCGHPAERCEYLWISRGCCLYCYKQD